MTDAQQAHVQGIVRRFNEAVTEKYDKGQREHGGDLWRKPGMLAAAKDEAIDLWIYLDTLEQQIAERAPGLTPWLTGVEQLPEDDGA
jgi:hypothetical protein